MRINKKHILITVGFILLLIGTVWFGGACTHESTNEPDSAEESVEHLELQTTIAETTNNTKTVTTQKTTTKETIETIEETTEETTTEEEISEEEQEEDDDYEYLGTYYITGYGAYCSTCNGGYSCTASGTSITPWWTVAMSSNYPFGTIIYIDGLGEFEVQDRGVGDGVVDIAVSECEHQGGNEAYNITGYYDVYVVEWG